MTENKNLAVIIQCRLSSTRLPGKALLDLGGKSVFEWTLDAMKQVSAATYLVATDEESFPFLEQIARNHGWDCMSGPLDDVLERYCMAIKNCGCKAVLRATADNPFLFYEAAQALVDEFYKQESIAHCDYMTWTGLPHGSGVEIFWADSLLRAASCTESAYDHEHVGPALYNHKDKFTSLFYKAPSRFYFPEYRTTIDTISDYRKALAIVSRLSGGVAPLEPYTTEQIVSALHDPEVYNTVLFFPCTSAGHGTGHLRRSLEAAKKIGAFVYISEDADKTITEPLIKEATASGLKSYQIVRRFPEKNEYSLIVADAFRLDEETARRLSEVSTLCAIDEGGDATDWCDVLFDILPSYKIDRPANISEPSFIALPKNVRPARPERFKKILVTLGGEDPAGLTVPAARFFAALPAGTDFFDDERNVTAILCHEKLPAEEISGVTFVSPIENLKERLSSYDLVVTHYGFTAFEALKAGCGVLLLSTSKLHENLAKKYGFLCLAQNALEPSRAASFFQSFERFFPDAVFCAEQKSYADEIKKIAGGRRYACPVCGEHSAENRIIARTKERTFRRCRRCSMIYISWNRALPMTYEKDYFAEQYKNQYGKTYLEDFESIKKAGRRRINEISSVLRAKNLSSWKILDVGCAYGPFLAAASERGWLPYGADISADAVEYIRTQLLFPAVQTSFPDFNPASEFGINHFDAVTMWFVIEHFADLKPVLEKVSALVKKGGVFAFSTPSGEGVSARRNTKDFFKASPSDHFTVWEPSRTAKILRQFGFEVVRIVSTGHHPERFPEVMRRGSSEDDFLFRYYGVVSRILKLGDTFEVYCRKL